ncbi:thiamine biosynthesis protein ApbE [Niastella yeongjuensis]|uniref:FAD:protein FMN transferase n=1 Tax=Niastella yeongjuensis TaxID=354355 RepID=A0A1V9EV84_9BACT|nr:FAD:protein FMN transferase [Niastella yeongjuensis]OQP49814.1 thiamine biosynthesis protein ApbE [Niastella yeongjuensis]SEP40040.1 thiamine biosynthesis lipoprotein [Niastella yeongjuensis]
MSNVLKQPLFEYKHTCKLMGNTFEITVVANDETWAYEKIGLAVNEIRRIEKLLTTFDENSQTNQVNSMAGMEAVPVDREVFGLIKRSLKISGVTDGAFDITYGSIDKRLWNFDRTMTSLPDGETARQSVRLINYHNVLLNEQACTVMLKEKGMRIGFGGIGKGYAADMARNLLVKEGVQSGIVNASGDLVAWGNQANGAPWTIGIAHPDNARSAFSWLNISDLAIATSGNYEKYVMIDGKKYSHTINPKTGMPVTGIKSVTIISPYAEIADAMATPVMVMGVKAGLHLINQIQHLGCILVDDDNNIYTTKNIQLK